MAYRRRNTAMLCVARSSVTVPPFRPGGIFVSDFEGEIGPDLFRKACEFGLEGMVSKHRDRAYGAGRSPNRVKVKNPNSPAMKWAKDAF
jgi:bifunctional non-homologous end joining protein LigD